MDKESSVGPRVAASPSAQPFGVAAAHRIAEPRMKLGELRSLGHNIADSLASGVGLLIGVYEMDVFGEAAASPEGFIVVDFLAGATTCAAASRGFKQAISRYSAALPELCAKHSIPLLEVRRLQARYGTDRVYGRHFTVTVETVDGRKSTDRYLGTPGRRLRTRQEGQ